MKATCVLGGLGEPRLVSALPGLKRDENGFILDAKQFGCCDATGAKLDLKAGVTTRCDLKPRLAAVATLLAQYGRWWDFSTQPLTLEHGLRVAAQDLKVLAAIKSGEQGRGRFIEGDLATTLPRQLWSVALAAAWRFGLNVHMVNLAKANSTDLRPKPLSGGRRGIIVVEQANKLSDPLMAERLETLISYAYGAKLPLWLEVWRQGDERAGAEAAAKSIARRVAAAKNRPPLDWLTDGVRRKLADVCATPEMPRTSKTARQTPIQKAGERRPDDFKLPWD